MIRAAITAAVLVAGVAHAAAPAPLPIGVVRADLPASGRIAVDGLDVVTEAGARLRVYVAAPCPGFELSAAAVLWQQTQSGLLLTDVTRVRGSTHARVFSPDGEDVGALLIAEGLAAPYAASAGAWCGGKYTETEGHDE